jgi:hypothetical protein
MDCKPHCHPATAEPGGPTGAMRKPLDLFSPDLGVKDKSSKMSELAPSQCTKRRPRRCFGKLWLLTAAGSGEMNR